MENIIKQLPYNLFDKDKLPERNKNGYVCHPHAEVLNRAILEHGSEVKSTKEFLTRLGYEIEMVYLKTDNETLAAQYFDSESDDCNAWAPTAPLGKGWLLVCINNSELGPVATFVRRDISAIKDIALTHFDEVHEVKVSESKPVPVFVLSLEELADFYHLVKQSSASQQDTKEEIVAKAMLEMERQELTHGLEEIRQYAEGHMNGGELTKHQLTIFNMVDMTIAISKASKPEHLRRYAKEYLLEEVAWRNKQFPAEICTSLQEFEYDFKDIRLAESLYRFAT